MIKRLSLFLVALLVVSKAFAFDFESSKDAGAIYYDLNKSKHEATVVSAGQNGWEYTGNIIIPDAIVVGGESYKVTTIGTGAFLDLSNLSSVTLGSNVTTIKAKAFNNVKDAGSKGIKINLESDALTTIETNAFHCTYIAPNKGDTLVLGKNIMARDKKNNYFSWCTFVSVNHFYVDPSSAALCTDSDGVLYSRDMTKLYMYPRFLSKASFNIPSSVTIVADYAFYNINGTKIVTGGENVVSMGSTISGLTRMDIGPNVTDMTTTAMMYTGDKFLPVIDANNQVFELIDSVLFKYTSTDTILCRYFGIKKAKSYAIPANVTQISTYAFYSLKNNNLVCIDYGLCSNLKASKIGEEAYLSTRDDLVFVNTENIFLKIDGIFYSEDTTKIVLYPSDVTMETYVMPNATTTLPRNVIKNNGFVKNFIINKNLSSLNTEHLEEMFALETYSVNPQNASYSSDDYGVLYNKSKTKLLSYPRNNSRIFYKVADGTQEITVKAFYGNKNLVGIDLGNDITSVINGNGNDMAKMGKLKYIRVGANYPPDARPNSFDSDMYGNVVLYVPAEYEKYYKNASVWNRFSIIKDTNDFINDVKSTKTEYYAEHYRQDTAGTGYLPAESVKCEGYMLCNTTAEPLNIEGFTPIPFEQKLLENNNVVVKIYYTRNSYTINWKSKGDVVSNGTYKYETKMAAPNVTITPDAGKHFIGWNPNPDATTAVTFDDNSLLRKDTTFHAVFATNDRKPYVVRHFLQNIEDDDYQTTPYATDTIMEVFGLQTSAVAKTITGFTAQDFNQKTVAEDGNTVVVIKYDRNNYTVEWKNGTSPVLSGSYKYGSNLVIPSDQAAVAGKHFIGWNTDANATVALSLENKTVEGAATYYAIFATNDSKSYTVNHYKQNLDGTYPTDPEETETGSGTVGLQTQATAKTYTGFTAPETISQEIIKADGTTVVDIKYTRNSYDVKWYNGSASVLTGNYKYGSALEIPADQKAEAGKHFVGWNTNASATSALTLTDATVESAVTYYAIFVDNDNKSYVVNHYQEGLDGNYPTTPTTTDNGSGVWGLQTNASAKNYEGFTAQNFSQATIKEDGTTVVEIYYKRNIHILTWSIGYGTLESESYTKGSVMFGATIIEPKLNREGYTHKGWSLTNGGNTTVVATQMPDVDLTYYDVWEVNKYKAKWYWNYTGSSEAEFTFSNVDYDAEIEAPAGTPDRENYTFIGWSKTKNGAVITDGDFGKMTTAGANFYAQWIPNKYNLTWNANGGSLSGSYTSGSVDYGTDIVKPNASRTGYTFIGWGESATATSTINIPLTMPGEDKEFFAIWKINQHTLTWNANSGELSGNYTKGTVTYGTTITAPSASRYGYTFKGWTTTLGSTETVEITTMPDSDVVYYAVWEANKHTLVWEANGGELSGTYTSGTVAYGTTIVAPTNVSRTGYKFAGWGESATSTNPTTVASTMPDNDVKYYALWVAKDYVVEWLLNDGTDNLYGSNNVAFGNAISKIEPDPAREHYQFLGWSKASNGNVTTDFGTMNANKVTFYAKWQINSNNLVWNANGGELSGEYTKGAVAYGIEIAKPTATRTGYSFVGWGTTADATIAVDISTMPDNDVEYFAIWSVNSYDVDWKFNDGSTLNYKTTSFEYGEPIAKPDDPEYEHYTFMGWSTTADGAVISDFGTMPAKDAAFYAVWELNTHSLSWNGNGGELSGEYTNGTVAYGTEVVEPTATRTGYSLTGWGTTADATIAVETETMPDNDVEYFAIWSLNSYNVEWKLNDGTTSSYKTSPFKYGEAIARPDVDPTRDHYTFLGWSDAVDGAAISDFGTMPAKDTAFYAVWELNTHSLSWNGNGGELSGEYTNGTVAYGTEVVEPTATRTGYSLVGWGTTSDATIAVETETMPDNDVEYFAIWKINKHFAVWYANNGTNDTIKVDTLDYETMIVAPVTTPTRDHYTFLGWSDAVDGAAISDFSTMPDKDTAFYAVWELNKHVTVWYANNGTNDTVKVDTLEYGIAIAEPANDPTRANYAFAGWAATTDGDALTDFGTMPDKDTAFYAVWALNKHVVVWHKNDGTGDKFQRDVLDFGDEIVAPSENPTRDNYTFMGWSAADGEVTTEFGTMPDQDTAFYAVWLINKHFAVWCANDGTNDTIKVDTLDFGAVIIAPSENPTRDNYAFMGWSATTDGTIISDFGTMPDQDTAFYAVWNINKHVANWYANDGTNDKVNVDTLDFGTVIMAPSEKPTRENYKFIGWSATADGDTTSLFGTMPDNDTAFYAVWESLMFDAVWYANNGTAEVFFTTHATVSTTLTAPATNPVRDNFTFKGWSATADGEILDNFGVMPLGGTQFYAVWEDVLYDAVWYANNGTAEIFFTTHASVSSTLTAPEANPVRDNFTFKGWSATADGEVTTDFGIMPVGGTKFYAVWEDVLYDALWYANNGTAEVFFTTHATVSTTLVAPEGNPEHGSYIFKGWSSTADGEPLTDFGIMPAGGTSFYAVWAPGEFTVVWDMNDGSGKTFMSQQVVLGEKIVAPVDSPSRKCYEFKGWSATADGDVTTDFGVMTADGAVFYAIWAGIVEFTAPESFETCENEKYVELTNVSDSVKFVWKVNGVVEPSQVGTIFTLPDNAKFSGTITVTGSFGGTEVTKEIKYIRKKDMITTMWDDVVSVINTDNMFQSYKWYHNDALIDTTEYYNEVGGLTGKYYLVATTSDGEEICSCERDFGKKPEVSISVYPNPAVERVLVKGTALEVGKSIIITDENGKVWLSREITDNDVEDINLLNLPQGLYIVKIDNKSISFIKL